ncbi:MAG: hypothetical protein JJ953_13435 [Gracilimonas sp.]|uniref:hypothetical protein n=1 Tax=Gracilimonas TaxID=649462 RepID=UPI001B2CF28A|nr:hypothetical protein [Gracilimonas sp.]MBO6587106.1 hypothetical protein [Gracilimonas sp.]MBO6614406.1 hypothetical protein [Gracilimonas sp.]
MKPIVRNILALITGLVVGGFVNMGIIMVSGFIIPPPAGTDVTTMEGLQESMHLFKPINFLMPFLAHALGTMVGALLTAFIATSSQKKWALGVGAFFLVGGIANVSMLPSPLWFNIVDIGGAYLPMAYLGAVLAAKFQNKDS